MYRWVARNQAEKFNSIVLRFRRFVETFSMFEAANTSGKIIRFEKFIIQIDDSSIDFRIFVLENRVYRLGKEEIMLTKLRCINKSKSLFAFHKQREFRITLRKRAYANFPRRLDFASLKRLMINERYSWTDEDYPRISWISENFCSNLRSSKKMKQKFR